MTYLIPTNWAMIHFCYCVVHAKTGRVRHCRDLVYASIKQSRAKVYLNTKPKTQKTWCHGRCGLCNAQSNNQEQMWPQPLDTQNKQQEWRAWVGIEGIAYEKDLHWNENKSGALDWRETQQCLAFAQLNELDHPPHADQYKFRTGQSGKTGCVRRLSI